jgi:hypothetical protein
VRLADDVGAEDLLKERQLGLAWRGALGGDPEDRAVALAESDRPVGADECAREVALLVLDDCQLADPRLQRRIRRQSLI